jgi:peptide/nickel transport system substrate-binding protein
VESVKKTHPQLIYQDFLSTVSHAIYMRTDMAPFNDVRVRRAISQALDRQAIIEAAWIRGEPTPAISRGLSEWSPRIDELGAGARYYQYDPKEARRLLTEAGFPKGFKTQMYTTGGTGAGPTMIDAAQLAQRYLKEVGIEAELKIQEFGAYVATTFVGKFEGMAFSPISNSWEPDSVLYGLYAPDQARNSGHVNDPTITAMLKAQRRTKDREARKQLIFDIQRYIAEQQYYVYLYCVGITGSWYPYVKNYAPNTQWDFGGRAAALWLER